MNPLCVYYVVLCLIYGNSLIANIKSLTQNIKQYLKKIDKVYLFQFTSMLTVSNFYSKRFPLNPSFLFDLNVSNVSPELSLQNFGLLSMNSRTLY